MAQKPRDAVVNFLSKFTAASRGPPCDSTALVSLINVKLSFDCLMVSAISELQLSALERSTFRYSYFPVM